MTLILNGTDNSATTPAVTGTDPDTGVYYPAANQVALATNGTQAMLANASQGVQFANAIGVGATTPTTSGAGITFPASQSASSNANTLDDYEEGTFTVGLTASSGSITLFGSGNGNGGRYVKIGSLVFISIWVRVQSVSSPSGNVTLTGLPFTANDIGVEARPVILCAGYNWNTGRTDIAQLTMSTGSGTTSAIFGFTTQTSWATGVNVAASWVQGATEIYINGCYTTTT